MHDKHSIIIKGILNVDFPLKTSEYNNFYNEFNDFFKNKGLIGGINSLKCLDSIKYNIEANFLRLKPNIDIDQLFDDFKKFTDTKKIPFKISKISDNFYNRELIPRYYEPKYLYHYTSIDTLELILKNRNIRFSSLKNVDDINESKTGDLGDLGRFCFVSCWTITDVEKIPLWNLYTPNMTGVRIKLPVDPFKIYSIQPGKFNTTCTPFDSNIDLENHYKKYEYMITQPYKIKIEPVIYSNDKDKIFPKISYKNEHMEGVNYSIIGKYKQKVWGFQDEWRYKFFICPWTIEDISSINSDDINDFVHERFKKVQLKYNDYFLEIDELKFKNMEITMGPKCNEDDFQRVKQLIELYNPDTPIIKSSVAIM